MSESKHRKALPRWETAAASVKRFGSLCALTAAVILFMTANRAPAGDSFAAVIEANQPKMVKIYGAGGVRGLEAYQSGFLVSDQGHILTVWSYVLDTDYITATLDDGRKFEAKLLGADPRLDLAVLKVDAQELPHFDLATAVPASSGSRVLAFSNLFGVASGDEPASVQHGIIAVKTRLDARRGTFETPYHGSVYVLDAMTNNPGAAGGALTNLSGELLAMLGKELRNAQNNIWLNYALPIDELRASVEQILQGKFRPGDDKPELKPADAVDLVQLGLVLVPDVLDRTPPYVDLVRGGSPAETAAVKPDDLIVFVGENLVHSCKGFREELARIEREAKIRLILMRGQELVEVELQPAPPAEVKEK
jgi:S1-C subfamily serine protease